MKRLPSGDYQSADGRVVIGKTTSQGHYRHKPETVWFVEVDGVRQTMHWDRKSEAIALIKKRLQEISL